MRVTTLVAVAGAVTAVALLGTEAAFPAEVAKLMDPKISPCEDFYKYSCGQWLATTEIPGNLGSFDYSGAPIYHLVDTAVKEIVNDNWPLLGDLWTSCMDTMTIRSLGNFPLRADLERILATKSTVELMAIVGDMNRYMPEVFTNVDIEEDPASRVRVPVIAPASTLLPDDPKRVEQYGVYIKTIMNLAGVESVNATILVERIINLEKLLKNPPVPSRTPSGRRLTTPQVHLAHVHVHLSIHKHRGSHKQSTTAPAPPPPPTYEQVMAQFPLSMGIIVNSSQAFQLSGYPISAEAKVRNAEWFTAMEHLLPTIPLEDLQVYVAFRFIHARIFELSSEFVKAYADYTQEPIATDREAFCLRRTRELLPNLLDHHFVAKVFDGKHKVYVNTMVKLLRGVLGQRITKLDWLDDATKKEAAAKLDKMTTLVGEPNVQPSYPFAFHEKRYFDNVVEAMKLDHELSALKIGTKPGPHDWDDSALTINAFYNPLKNSITLPAAELQAPHLSLAYHPARNFGGIGAIIGHEISHGFDTTGKDFDGDGLQRDWWTAASKAAYEHRTTCMRQQYSTFEVRGETGNSLGFVDGNLTIGENIADNGGLALAFDAYRAFMTTSEAENVGELTEREGEQLYFVAFAQTWCGKSHDDTMRQRLQDAHAPHEFRVKGAVMNSPAFARAFECSPGSPMNPETKCPLW